MNSLYLISFQWFHFLISLNHLLVTANSSFNFLIYFNACHGKAGTKMRRGMVQLARKICRTEGQ